MFRIPSPPTVDLQQLRTEIEAATGLTVTGGERRDGFLFVEFETTEGVDDIALQAQLEQIVADHKTDETTQLDQLIEKARRVWNGTDTFTQAQAQKILAGLVLLENRRR